MISTLLFLIVLGLLTVDSFGSNGTSLKYLGVDSTLVAVSFLLGLSWLAVFDRFPLPRTLIFLNQLVAPFLTLAAFSFVLINYLTYSNFIRAHFNIAVENFVLLAIFVGSIVYLDHSRKFKGNFEKKLVYFLGPIILLSLFYIDVISVSLFHFLTGEDRVFEDLQFWFYLSSGILALQTAMLLSFKRIKYLAILFLLLSLGLFFIAGEEISWGQRLFDIETPAIIKEGNFQSELTLHNQGPIQRYIHFFYIGLGLFGAGSRILLDRFFPVNISQRFRLVTPSTLLFFYFFSVFAFYFLNQYMTFYYELWTNERVGMGKWQEVAELFASFGLLLFTISSLNLSRALRRKS